MKISDWLGISNSKKLDTIISTLKRIEGKEDKMALDFKAVNDAMDKMSTAIQDGVAEITELIGKAENPADQVALQSIADKLTAGAASLEAAKAASDQQLP